MVHQAGFPDTSTEALKKMKKLDAAWVGFLREMGLSDAAIQAARPDPPSHRRSLPPPPLVGHFFQIVEDYEPEKDAGVDDYLAEARRMISILPKSSWRSVFGGKAEYLFCAQ